MAIAFAAALASASAEIVGSVLLWLTWCQAPPSIQALTWLGVLIIIILDSQYSLFYCKFNGHIVNSHFVLIPRNHISVCLINHLAFDKTCNVSIRLQSHSLSLVHFEKFSRWVIDLFRLWHHMQGKHRITLHDNLFCNCVVIDDRLMTKKNK